jgi:hypothetical protein
MRVLLLTAALLLLLITLPTPSESKEVECAALVFHGDEVDVCYSPLEGWPTEAPEVLEAVRRAFLSGVSETYFSEHFDLVRLSIFGRDADLRYRFTLSSYEFESTLAMTLDPPALRVENFVRPREVTSLVAPQEVMRAGLTCRREPGSQVEFTWHARIGPGFVLYASGALNEPGYDTQWVFVDLETGAVIECNSPGNLLPGYGEPVILEIGSTAGPYEPDSTLPLEALLAVFSTVAVATVVAILVLLRVNRRE